LGNHEVFTITSINGTVVGDADSRASASDYVVAITGINGTVVA